MGVAGAPAIGSRDSRAKYRRRLPPGRSTQGSPRGAIGSRGRRGNSSQTFSLPPLMDGEVSRHSGVSKRTCRPRGVSSCTGVASRTIGSDGVPRPSARGVMDRTRDAAGRPVHGVWGRRIDPLGRGDACLVVGGAAGLADEESVPMPADAPGAGPQSPTRGSPASAPAAVAFGSDVAAVVDLSTGVRAAVSVTSPVLGKRRLSARRSATRARKSAAAPGSPHVERFTAEQCQYSEPVVTSTCGPSHDARVSDASSAKDLAALASAAVAAVASSWAPWRAWQASFPSTAKCGRSGGVGDSSPVSGSRYFGKSLPSPALSLRVQHGGRGQRYAQCASQAISGWRSRVGKATSSATFCSNTFSSNCCAKDCTSRVSLLPSCSPAVSSI